MPLGIFLTSQYPQEFFLLLEYEIQSMYLQYVQTFVCIIVIRHPLFRVKINLEPSDNFN